METGLLVFFVVLASITAVCSVLSLIILSSILGGKSEQNCHKEDTGRHQKIKGQSDET